MPIISSSLVLPQTPKRPKICRSAQIQRQKTGDAKLMQVIEITGTWLEINVNGNWELCNGH